MEHIHLIFFCICHLFTKRLICYKEKVSSQFIIIFIILLTTDYCFRLQIFVLKIDISCIPIVPRAAVNHKFKKIYFFALSTALMRTRSLQLYYAVEIMKTTIVLPETFREKQSKCH